MGRRRKGGSFQPNIIGRELESSLNYEGSSAMTGFSFLALAGNGVFRPLRRVMGRKKHRQLKSVPVLYELSSGYVLIVNL